MNRVAPRGEAAPASGDDRLRRLLMAVVDGEIDSTARREVEVALAKDPQLHDELAVFRRLKEVTKAMTPKKPSKEVWETYWEDVYRRLERGLGWILVSVGAAVFLTWSLWVAARDIIADTEIPGFVRWSILALLAGLVVLFVSVVRERLFMRKRDPYKDVIR